jgi:hypothetical protein
MDEELRAVLLWLIEINDRPNLPKLAGVCATCGHERWAHEISGDADDPTPWPCTYPKHIGAPHGLCTCADYQPQQNDDDDIPTFTI